MSILVKRAVYKKLRSSVGYYDARRILRHIQDIGSLDEIDRNLRDDGFDERHITFTLEALRAINNYPNHLNLSEKKQQ
jgi:hypothetical protein